MQSGDSKMLSTDAFDAAVKSMDAMAGWWRDASCALDKIRRAEPGSSATMNNFDLGPRVSCAETFKFSIERAAEVDDDEQKVQIGHRLAQALDQMQGVASVLESHCCDGDDTIAALPEVHFRGNLKQIASTLSISSKNVETRLSVGFNEVSTNTKHKHGNADCPNTRSPK